MTSSKHEIGIGTRVSYEDMANPLREGVIVGEVGGGVQWAIVWDDRDADSALYEVDGVRFHTTVTKHMLASRHAKQVEAKHRTGGKIAGWDAIVRPCSICGREVTSPNPEVDYCKGCYYTGAALERNLRTDERDVLARIGALDGVADATVWHTGGGCFNLAVTLDDGRLITPSMAVTDEASGAIFAEPGIPVLEEGDRWALVISESEEAWSEWNEEKMTFPNVSFDDDQLVAAIAQVVAGEEVTV